MKLASMTSWSSLLRGSKSLPMGAPSRWQQLATGFCSLALAGGLLATQPPVEVIINTQPDSQIVLANGSVTLEVGAIVTDETDTLEYQWFKDGVAIPLANLSSYSIPAAAAGDAARYTCLVQAVTAEAEKLSDPAVLVVASAVTGDPQTLSEGGNLRLSIPAPAAPARPVLSYSWYLGETLVANVPLVEETGRSIRGATTRTLSIAKLLPSDDGIYTGVLSGYGDEVTIGTFDVTVRPRPILDTVEVGPFEWRVGESLSYDFDITNGEDVGDVTFTASRLPAGLSIDSATGVVSGRPLRATTDPVSFRITATTAQGLKSIPVDFPYTIAPVAPTLAGSYHGLVIRQAAGEEAPLGGSIRVTVTSTGAYSGVLVRGGVSTPLTGVLETNEFGGVAETTSIPNFGFTIDYSGAGLGMGSSLTGGFTTPDPVPPASQTSVVAWRQTAPAGTLAGQYNALVGGLSESLTPTPQGLGYFTVKVAANTGVARVSGRLADGTVVTLSTAICALTGPAAIESYAIVPIYRSLYDNQGFFTSFQVIINEVQMMGYYNEWKRPAIVGNVYPEGFEVQAETLGAKYSAPAPGDVILGLAAGANNAVLELSSSALDATISQSLTIAAPASTTVNLPLAGNLSKLVINQFNAATGLFNGSATFTDVNGEVTTSRKAKFQGLVVPGFNEAGGYFLLNEAGSNNVISGQVSISASQPLIQ